MPRVPINPTPQDIYKAFEALGPIVGGKLVVTAVNTTLTTVAHGLGRVPADWFELSPQNGGGAVKQASPSDETYLYLITSSAVPSARLWVY